MKLGTKDISMKQALIIISTRQVDNIDYRDKIFNNLDLYLIATPTEVEKLNSKSYFTKIFTVQKLTKYSEVHVEYEYDELLQIVEGLFKSYNKKIQLVSFNEFSIENVSKLKEAFKISAQPSKLISLLRDKKQCKDFLEQLDIRVPKNSYCSTLQNFQYDYISQKIARKFVLKPFNSAGSDGVFIVNNQNELDYALKCIGDTNLIKNYEVEEFIEGRLFHCDSIVKDGNIVFMECCEYNCVTYNFQQGSPLGSMMIKEGQLKQKILDFSAHVIKCLGVIEGSQHLEVFVTDKEEIVFLEIGPRLPGIIMVKAYEKIFGINLINVEIGLLFNNGDLLKNDFNYNNYAFFMMYPYSRGKIIKKNDLTTPINTTITYLKEIGDTITHNAKSNLDATAIILGWDTDYEIVRHTFFEREKFNPYTII